MEGDWLVIPENDAYGEAMGESLMSEGVFRMYPVKGGKLADPADPKSVCFGCLSGTCCSSEDPITLTAFDILRLSTFFNLSPAEWMSRFTQDRFEGEDSQEKRTPYLEDPNSSTVTWLRRRANLPSSPCVFLKYIKEPDGTPRRVCAVHEARPLACREYYFDTCQTRWTGELAALQSFGYEQLRDGQITAQTIDDELHRLENVDPETSSMADLMQLAYWVEMRRALDTDQANNEGCHSYDPAHYQDPIEIKLNRMLSRTWLRLEEKYGPVPWGEQLHIYTAGLSFVGTADWKRLIALTEIEPGRNPLFAGGDYPHYVAARIALFGAGGGSQFPELAEAAIEKHSRQMQAALRASMALVRFAGFVAAVPRLLEMHPPGKIERDILFAVSRIEAVNHPVWKINSALLEVKDWASTKATLPVSWLRKLRARPAGSVEEWLNSQGRFGGWGENPSRGEDWPENQEEYWTRFVRATSEGIIALHPGRTDET